MGRRPGPRSPAGLVVPRSRTHPVLVAAALLTVLLSTVVLTSLVVHSDAVPEQGLTQVLTADPARAAVLVSADGGDDAGGGADAVVRDVVAQGVTVVPTTVVSAAQSSPYVIVSGARPPAAGALTSFWSLDGLGVPGGPAELTAGSWPGVATGTTDVPVAVSTGAAAAMGVAVGDRLVLQSATFGPDASAVVTGTYAPLDPADPVWRLDPTGGTGTRQGDHPSYGPLAVPRGTLTALAADSTASWLVQPDLTQVQPDDLPRLADQLTALRARMPDDDVLGDSANVTTGLGALLVQAARSLVVSRSTTPVPALLLAVIATYAVAYLGRLLVGERADERALLQARGASRAQDARGALTESALLVLPAALVGAPLVVLLSPLVGAAYGTGTPVPWSAVVPVAAVVAVAGLVVLALPAVLAAAGRRGRDAPRPTWQRAGLDLVLVALAVAAYLLLRTSGSPFAAADVRNVRADPVYVLAPVVLLLSVALLALRLLPVLGSLVDRVTARTRGAGVALGLWPVARRPARHAGPLLLLVLAVSVGVMAVTATATGARSRDDQADFQVGADVRVDLVPGTSLPAEALAVPGVTTAMPVAHLQADTGSRDGAATPVVALDAASAAATVRLRSDLGPTGPAAYDDLLAAGPAGEVPAIATRALLDARGIEVGDTLDTVVSGVRVPVQVVAEVAAFPTIGEGEGLVLDAGRLTEVVGGRAPAPDQWWLAVDAADRGAPARQLADRTVVSAVLDRDQVAAALAADPLAQGFAGALRVALIGGALLAAVGTGVGVLLAARERRGELGLLRALGARRRDVRSALLLEQILVVAVGLVIGVVVGLAVAALVLPYTTVSARTGAVVPPALITVPWPAVVVLVAVLGLAMLAVAVLVTAAARRTSVATTLREAAP